MKTKSFPSSWLHRADSRLDCAPYLSGAVEARVLLEETKLKKDLLCELTVGHNGGIFNGPQFVRNYVEDRDFGVPFMTTSVMLRADLSNAPFLRKADAESSRLSYLKIPEGSTLITCSGNGAGKLAFTRPEMTKFWSCQDIIKVVPDSDKTHPGYLYSYLRSKFGIPLILSGVYGGAIRHIEPKHIEDLPVPRVGDALEREIGEKVVQSAMLRDRSSVLKREGHKALSEFLGLSPLKDKKDQAAICGSALSGLLEARIDSQYYIGVSIRAAAEVKNSGERIGSRKLEEVAEVFTPNIFKRIYAEDPNFGYPYVTGADTFLAAPVPDQYLAKSVADRYRLVIEKGMILIHEAGQRYGLIGHSVMVGDSLSGFACTNNMIRVIPNEPSDWGFISGVLSSDHGVQLLKREAAGSSIPHLDNDRAKSVSLPWPDSRSRSRLGKPFLESVGCADEANNLESEAVQMLEEAIDKN